MAKHGVAFDDAIALFLDPAFIYVDTTRPGDQEARTKAIGQIAGRIFTIVFTSRGTVCRIISARRSNPDNPPMAEEELARAESAALVRRVRAATGLSQSAFASQFHINHGRLRDLEQGRSTADSALMAYLRMIEKERNAVERALA